jgi:hypothetical protein
MYDMEINVMSKLIDLGRVSRETMGGTNPKYSEDPTLQNHNGVVRICNQNFPPFWKGVTVYEVPQAQGKDASWWSNCWH